MAKSTFQVTFSEFLVLSCLVALGAQAWVFFPNYGPAFVLIATWLLVFLRCALYKRVSSSAIQAFIVLLVFYARLRDLAGRDWWLTPFFLADAAFYTLVLSLLHVVSITLVRLLIFVYKKKVKTPRSTRFKDTRNRIE